MASTPNPTPNYSSVTPRPSNNQNHNHNNHHSSNKLKEICHHHRHSHSHSRCSTSSISNPPLAAAVATVAAEIGVVGGGSSYSNGAASSVVTPYAASGRRSGSSTGTAPPAYSSSLGSYLGARKSRLAPEFSGKRSTQFAAKMHSNRPRIRTNKHPHTKVAEEALHCLLNAGDNSVDIDRILFSYENKLRGCDDYIYLLKEFANSRHLLQAEKCYNFSMCICKDDDRVSKGKLTSNMIGTLGRLGRIEQAFNLFDDARLEGHGKTVHSFSAMITAFGRNGCFHDSVDVFRSMPKWGLEPDLITYNAIIDAGAKSQIDFDIVVKFFDEMVANNLKPDRVTYNSLLAACAPKGLWELAQSLLREMDQKGVCWDLVTYNTYLDTLCKGGQMELAKMVFEDMPSMRVWPSVVTFNTMMDGYAKANRLEDALNLYDEMKRRSILVDGVSYTTLIGVYAKLGRFDEAIDKFKEMERCGIKIDVVTFSAILNACSGCNSFEDASKLLDELRLFDNQVFGVAHGLLMGYRDQVWYRALSLFDEIRRMDSSTTSAFYNALTDMLWHFGQRRGAQMVVFEGRQRNVWKGEWSISCLDLHLMSCGAACAMVHAWLLNIHDNVYKGYELPHIISIITGWGKHSKVVGDGILKKAIEALLDRMSSPFKIAECNIGRFVSPGYMVASWLRNPNTYNLLVLNDVMIHSEAAGPSH